MKKFLKRTQQNPGDLRRFELIPFILSLLPLLLNLILIMPAQAALFFEPNAPLVASGGQIRLSVGGAVEPVTWSVDKGGFDSQTQTAGLSVIYTAPAMDEADFASVEVRDAAGQSKTLKVLIRPPSAISAGFSHENAQWWSPYRREFSTGPMLLSEDGQILWAGTGEGLEKRDAGTGRLLRKYSVNKVSALTHDGEGGLWVGTQYHGLSRLHAAGHWSIYNTGNSSLPSDQITSLSLGGRNSVWVGTVDGLAQRDAAGSWTVYHAGRNFNYATGQYDIPANSGLPHNDVRSLAGNGSGGLWIGTYSGLARFDTAGNWAVYRSNGGSIIDSAKILVPDGAGGVWVGTWYSGLLHFDAAGNPAVYHAGYEEWEPSIYGSALPANSGLPNNTINGLLRDAAGDLWVATNNGLARFDKNGGWTIYNSVDIHQIFRQFFRVGNLSPDGSGGLWLVSLDHGLVHFQTSPVKGVTVNSKRQNASWPDLWANALAVDVSGGLWVGANDGLVRLDAAGNWGRYTGAEYLIDKLSSVYIPGNSDLPGNIITHLDSDGAGGLWVGTSKGLARFDASANWTVYTKDNSSLPGNTITSLARDHAGNLWAGIKSRQATLFTEAQDGGLARLGKDGLWTLYNKNNSALPADYIPVLTPGTGEDLWGAAFPSLSHYLGRINGNLFRLDSAGNWIIYNSTNSDLTDDGITTLHNDRADNLWVALSDKGLARLDTAGNWTLYNAANTGLPGDIVNALESDGAGGLWVGTNNGLLHQDATGRQTTYNTANSGLPGNFIRHMKQDGAGGLWLAIGDYLPLRLHHLSFGRQTGLARVTGNAASLKQKRAALLINPQAGESSPLETATFGLMSGYVYRSLLHRGYNPNEIYVLSATPELDADGDGESDWGIVDAPVKVVGKHSGAPRRDINRQDLHEAFQWAANQGRLDQPLLVYITGYGGTEGIRLDSQGTVLGAEEIGLLLDSYQANTGNAVVVILDSAYSATLIPALSAKNRLVIAATQDHRVYYDGLGAWSFSRFFFEQLRDLDQNLSFVQAFRKAEAELNALGGIFSLQHPQLDDNGDGIANSLDGAFAGMLCLNGCIGGIAKDAAASFPLLDTLAHTSTAVNSHVSVHVEGAPANIARDMEKMFLYPETVAHNVTSGQTVELAVRVSGIPASRVSAVIFSPQTRTQRTDRGFSPTPPAHMDLEAVEPNLWTGQFSGFPYQGDYIVRFIATDAHGFPSAYASVTLTQTQGKEVIRSPVPARKVLSDGNILRVKLPFTEGEDRYVGIELPDGKFYVLDKFNNFLAFNGELPPWQGDTDMLEVKIAAWVPRGDYKLYLLRLPAGMEPWTNRDSWQLGIDRFTVW